MQGRSLICDVDMNYSGVFLELNAERVRKGLNVNTLCRRAGVPYSTWWRASSGKVGAWRPGTVTLLRRALAAPENPARSNGEDPSPDALIAAAYRATVLYIATRLGLPAEEVARRPRARKFWKVRALAIYATRVGFDIRGARLARALKTSKQLVDWSTKQANAMRDDGNAVDLILRDAALLIAAQEND